MASLRDDRLCCRDEITIASRYPAIRQHRRVF
jgi:hypothetical protein